MDKKEFLEKYLTTRDGTNCLKKDYLIKRFKDPDLVPMWVADMEFKTPDSVLDALRKRIDHGIFGYTFLDDSYYNSYSKWMEDNFSYPVDRKFVRTASGVVPALYTFVNCYTNPKDKIMIMPPVYYPFHNVITDTGREKVICDLIYKDKRFYMDFDKIEENLASEDVKMLILCSPHNPASRVWTEEELDRLFSICEKYNVLIVSDEIHQDFVFGDNKHVPAPIVSNGKYKDRIILVNAASKTFNLAGLLHSNIVIENESLRKKLDEYYKTHIQTEVNIFGTLATKAAYDGGKEWLDALRSVILDNYTYLKETLKREAPLIDVVELEGTYLPMIDLSKILDFKNDEKVIVNNMPVSKATKDFAQDKCRLAVDYGEWFGEEYKGFIRLNLATDPQIVKNVVDKIVEESKNLGGYNE